MKAKEAAANWNAVASNYDLATFTFEPFAQWLASECQAHAKDRALDVGCGTGISLASIPLIVGFIDGQGRVTTRRALGLSSERYWRGIT